jgi:septal ring factor EnvC (AmiA/AmiB activator)
VLCASAGWSARAPAQSESALRDRIAHSRAHERELSGAVARLDALIARTGREIAIVQGRLDDVEAELVRAEARLAQTRADLRAARIRLLRLRRRLADGRATLADQLVASYKSDPPDIVSLVLGADSFADLLEQVEFIKRISAHNAGVVDDVRKARADTEHATTVLARLEVRRSEAAADVGRRRDALASMRDGLGQRQATLVRARGARARALAGTRSGRRSAQRSLNRLIAERERAAAAASAGPGGPWAIPWPIVQCESGGQNLPPNSAGASGYYQMLPSTWKGLGGSTRHAYQASKAEQDRLAARLWAGGAGARNWVCAELV